MNKVLISFIIGLVIGAFCSYSFYSTESNVDSDIVYHYLGRDRVPVSYDRADFYEKESDPFGVYNRKNGVIPDDSTVVKIAELILFPIYGKETIINQRPYSVSLKNDSVWYICGNLNHNSVGGYFEISIRRDDGKVLMISHSK